MTDIKNFISILNWIDSRFTVEDLETLKLEQVGFEKILGKFTKSKKNEFEKVYSSVEKSLQNGYNILCVTDKKYPEDLKRVFKHPVPLMYKGEFKLNQFNLGVVGSRRPQSTTNEWLNSELLEALAVLQNNNVKVNVFSGGAYGVDQMSHKVALLSNIPTTCFLPTGVNTYYPRSLVPLAEQIINNGGAVVSSFPPNFPIYKSNFYFRNKILVILSNLIFIAEARRRSGTIMTANMAVSSGKSIVVLPQAPVKNCLGSLDLINSGIPIIRCKKDLVCTVKELNF